MAFLRWIVALNPLHRGSRPARNILACVLPYRPWCLIEFWSSFMGRLQTRHLVLRGHVADAAGKVHFRIVIAQRAPPCFHADACFRKDRGRPVARELKLCGYSHGSETPAKWQEAAAQPRFHDRGRAVRLDEGRSRQLQVVRSDPGLLQLRFRQSHERGVEPVVGTARDTGNQNTGTQELKPRLAVRDPKLQGPKPITCNSKPETSEVG